MTTSLISEYEFIKNANNDIVSAVFPMHQYLKKENNKRMILGGSIEGGTSRFDELGIPAGLYLETTIISHDTVRPKLNKFEIIDDNLFDKLLGKVSSVKPYSGTRKKYYKPKNAKTKKSD
jgi:hypothetical protein